MKSLILIIATMTSITANSQIRVDSTFNAEKISRTASFTAKADVNQVFPLFGPYDERKWVHGWDPVPIFPKEEVLEEGVTFKTKGSFEPEYLWRIIQLDKSAHMVQYLVTTANRQWSIKVGCRAQSIDNTAVTVTYAFTSLNQKGADYNRQSLEKMYAQDLKDWEEAINYYLDTGKTMMSK